MVILTAITKNNDSLLDDNANNGEKFIAYLDKETKNETFGSGLWEIREIEEDLGNGTLNAKPYKITPHKFIKTDISIWIDGNIGLKKTPQEIVDYMLGDADIGLFKHPYRNCVYDEGLACIGKYKDPEIHKKIFDQLDFYKASGYLINAGLYECGVLVLRHTENVKEFCEAWWKEICRFSFRDQISFPVILKDFNIKVNAVSGNVRDNDYFHYKKHL